MNSVIGNTILKKSVAKNYEKIIIKDKDEIIFIPLKEILFIEKQNKNTLIHTKNAEYNVNQTLTDLENILNDDFIRVHKSFIVNKHNIAKIKHIQNRSYEIKFFKTEKVALMSRYKFNELKEKIIHS